MNEEIQIETPLADEQIDRLRAGDPVRISGIIYSARDQAHKRLCALIEAGQKLPVDLSGQVIYFVGPTPAAPGRCIGAAGPTTSARMDAFSPVLIRAGLKGMIGKGYRGEPVRRALQQYKAVHFATLGGAGALLSKHIMASEIVTYEDLGAEAIRRLIVKNFPAVVAYDAFGGSVYNR
ncbi:MAG: Fe-S-containing hydro-lyase [Sedimentisphaerales bacterium]|nr:Fe-S-containing hydro-lyase [Sedimentisphaerales bacterium]